jgi:hypothetical protein
MTQRLQYFVIFYSPEIVKNVRINLGLVVLAPDPKATCVCFVSDWDKVRHVWPDAEIELLRATCCEIEARIKAGDEEIIRVMEDSFSNVIQVSDRMDYFADDPIRAMDELAEVHL